MGGGGSPNSSLSTSGWGWTCPGHAACTVYQDCCNATPHQNRIGRCQHPPPPPFFLFKKEEDLFVCSTYLVFVEGRVTRQCLQNVPFEENGTVGLNLGLSRPERRATKPDRFPKCRSLCLFLYLNKFRQQQHSSSFIVFHVHRNHTVD